MSRLMSLSRSALAQSSISARIWASSGALPVSVVISVLASRSRPSAWPRVPLCLFQLGRQRIAEIGRFVHLANFDFSFAVKWVRTALHPFDRFFLRLHLKQPKACDQFRCLRERPVGHVTLFSRQL